MIVKQVKAGTVSDPGHCLYYFPWLRIENTVQINQLTLLPYPSEIFDEECSKTPWLAKRIRDIHKMCLEPSGKSVQSFTVVKGPGGILFAVNDRPTQNALDALEKALNLLGCRYKNYDSEQLSGLHLEMHSAAITESGDEILEWSGTWFYKSWKPIRELGRPVQVENPGIEYPLRRIRELFQAIQNSDDPLRERLALALRFLKLSALHTAQQENRVCLELLTSAFEYLFGHTNIIESPCLFAFKLEELWNYPFRNFEYHPTAFKNKDLKQIMDMQSFRLAKQPGSQKTWLQAWFLELFKLRNDLLSNSPVNLRQYAWTLTQHLRVASEILPMTMIIILSRDNKTRLPLKMDDEKRISTVDAYIRYARSMWYSESGHSEMQPSWLKGKVLPNLYDSLPEESDAKA